LSQLELREGGRLDEENTDRHADGLGLWAVQHAGSASGSKQWLGRGFGAQSGFADEAGSLVAAASPPPLRMGPPLPLAQASALLVIAPQS
jgi:hypothetical protein